VTDPRPSLRELTDQDVVLRARDGQEAAYRELIRRYERPVFSLIYRMVRDRETAEDLAQETFIKVLNAIASYRPEFKFSSWVFKIANNTAIDHLRRRELDTLSLEGSPHAATPDAVEATTLQVSDGSETPPCRGTSVRGDRRDARSAPRNGEDLHPQGPARTARGSGAPARLKPNPIGHRRGTRS